jgi:hypothetical protein
MYAKLVAMFAAANFNMQICTRHHQRSQRLYTASESLINNNFKQIVFFPLIEVGHSVYIDDDLLFENLKDS